MERVEKPRQLELFTITTVGQKLDPVRHILPGLHPRTKGFLIFLGYKGSSNNLRESLRGLNTRYGNWQWKAAAEMNVGRRTIQETIRFARICGVEEEIVSPDALRLSQRAITILAKTRQSGETRRVLSLEEVKNILTKLQEEHGSWQDAVLHLHNSGPKTVEDIRAFLEFYSIEIEH